MAERQRISVAIASYRGAPYIGAQLDSIASQTQLPDEVVVSDDCSPDDTAKVVESFAATAPFPVRLVVLPRQSGIIENFYSAFAHCDGDIIYYCDQDDVWAPDKVARVQAAFLAGIMLVIHGSAIVDQNLVDEGKRTVPNPVRGSLAAPVDTAALYGFGHQMAFRRDVLGVMRQLRATVEADPQLDLENNLDGYIPFCASLLGGITILADPLTSFRRHELATSTAGFELSQASGQASFAERARQKMERDIRFGRERIALIDHAMAEGIVVGASTAALRRAVERKVRRTEAAMRAVDDGTMLTRLGRLMTAMPALVRPTGFSNDRRLHGMAVAAAAALG